MQNRQGRTDCNGTIGLKLTAGPSIPEANFVTAQAKELKQNWCCVCREISLMGGRRVFHCGETVHMETVAAYGRLLMPFSVTRFPVKLSLTIAFHFHKTSVPSW